MIKLDIHILGICNLYTYTYVDFFFIYLIEIVFRYEFMYNLLPPMHYAFIVCS